MFCDGGVGVFGLVGAAVTRANDPAFPHDRVYIASHEGKYNEVVPNGGLTTREYFAAMAMQGFVLHYSGYVNSNFETDPDETAERAIAYADALIAELEKK